MEDVRMDNKRPIHEIIENDEDSDQREFNALIGSNLGAQTLKLSMSISDFIDFSHVANPTNVSKIEDLKDQFVAQREIHPDHARGLALYVLKGLVISRIIRMTKQNLPIDPEILKIKDQITEAPFAALQPVVVNIRNTDELFYEPVPINGRNSGFYKITLSKKKHTMFVVDGQHRTVGFSRIVQFLDDIITKQNYSASSLFKPVDYDPHKYFSDKMLQFWTDVRQIAIMDCTLSVECHIGLDAKAEQQLFFDLNGHSKPVSKSVAFAMDHGDAINNFVRNTLIGEDILPFEPTAMDQNHWDRDQGKMSRKDVNNVTAIMALGKTNSKSATPYDIGRKKEYMVKLWEAILNVPGFAKEHAKKNTVLGQTVVLKGVAALSYSLAWGHKGIQNKDHYEKLLNAIRLNQIDFSHENKLWQCLFMTSQERDAEFPGLNDVLVLTGDYLPDYGLYDKENRVVRFGSRHSDIFPKIGDMLRWTLGFPPRPTKTRGKL